MRLEPPASLVDWGVLGAVAVLLATGVASLFAATPRLAWIYGAHAVAGIGLPVLLFWKLRRVRARLRPSRWTAGTVASVAALVLTLAALATGLYWALGSGFSVGPTTVLTVHAVLGLLVVVPLLVHLAARLRAPRTDVDAGRRAAVGYSVVAAVGLAGFDARKRLSAAFGTVGRFTGSKHVGGEGNEFPETSWVADDPDPIDTSAWTLAVEGAVERSVEYGYDDLAPDDVRKTTKSSSAAHQNTKRSEDSDEALLDCTSGWYATREWRGVRVGRLLDDTGVTEDAGWVTFESVTGYRWTLPIAEARDALLATHVGGERLTPGHGFPLRLVAPGRRGFQWVKWVERIEVRTAPDYGQWVAIFTSGFD